MDFYQWSADLTGQAVGILEHYPGPVMIACATVGTGLMTFAVMRWKENRRPKDEVEAMRRSVELEQKFADRFGDALYDMLVRQEITRHEYKKAVRKFNLGYHWRALIERKNKSRTMKHRIIRNCEAMHSTPLPKLVGPKPGEGVPVVALAKTISRKRWIVVGTAALRRKPA